MRTSLSLRTFADPTVSALFILLLATQAVHGQQGSVNSNGPPFLNPVVVTGTTIPPDETVIPTVRPTSSVFGLDQSVMDIPRNLAILSRTELDDIDIRGARDFAELTNSMYTGSTFGHPFNPAIRGQLADVFYNGMRMGLSSYGYGLPIDFNSIESIDVLKGPPTVVYGVSEYVGGFVNFITKQPFTDTFHGTISATAGTYDQYRWTADIGGPIIPGKLAFRISYLGENSGSFYENDINQTESIYGALTWTPTSAYTLALNVAAESATWTENEGINRPTQNLVNNGEYLTGYVQGWNGIGRDYREVVQAGDNVIVPMGTTNLSRRIRLLGPGDNSHGHSVRAQAIQTLVLNDDASIVNNTMFEYQQFQEKQGYYYAQIDGPLISIENRTELRLNFAAPTDFFETLGIAERSENTKSVRSESDHTPLITGQINLGLDVHYQETTGFEDFFAEPENAWDLSLSRSYIRFQNFGPADIPVAGYPGYFATPGELNGDTNRSRICDIAPFYQQIVHLGDRFSLLAGVRADLLWVDVIDPLYDQAISRGLGYLLAKTNRGSAVVIDPNFNISPTFKPWKWLTTYFTYNYSQSIGQGLGGGVPAYIPIPVSANLHRPSQLFELGAKASLVNDTLFISADIFQQTRFISSFGGLGEDDIVRGIELDATYQPNRNFYVTAEYSLLDSYIHGDPQVSQPYPVNAPQQQLPGGYILTDNFVTLPNGSYRQAGLPKHSFNFLARYQIPTEYGTFGAILGTTVTSTFFLGYNGYVIVPWQHNMDLTFFYRTKDNRFEARLALLNLTNQKNWSPQIPLLGYDSVVADWPFHLELTLTLRF